MWNRHHVHKMCCILIYMFMQDTYWRNDKDAGRLLYKNIYLSLYCKGSKRVTQGLRVRGSWRPNRNCNILTLTLMAVTLCPFILLMLGSTLLGAGFLYRILSASSLNPKSSGPQAPSAWCGFPYHISSITPSNLQLNWHLTSVLTALYNNSTPTRSPTWSLKSHV